MYDSSFPPPVAPPPLLPEQQKRPVLGIIALVLAILAFLIMCLDVFLIIGLSGGNIASQQYGGLDIALSCLAGLSGVIALVLGILSLTRKEPMKALGIIAVILSAVYLLIYCALIGINLINVMGTLG